MPKILVVDDDPAILTLEERLLQREGYEVVKASDGASAVLILTEQDFDLILMDVMMPNFNGFEVGKILRNLDRNQRVPLVFVSARTDAPAYKESMGSGGTAYLTKPFTSKQLISTVNALLRLPRPKRP
jgi:DNA-binding response OmpR family regulator